MNAPRRGGPLAAAALLVCCAALVSCYMDGEVVEYHRKPGLYTADVYNTPIDVSRYGGATIIDKTFTYINNPSYPSGYSAFTLVLGSSPAALQGEYVLTQDVSLTITSEDGVTPPKITQGNSNSLFVVKGTEVSGGEATRPALIINGSIQLAGSGGSQPLVQVLSGGLFELRGSAVIDGKVLVDGTDTLTVLALSDKAEVKGGVEVSGSNGILTMSGGKTKSTTTNGGKVYNSTGEHTLFFDRFPYIGEDAKSWTESQVAAGGDFIIPEAPPLPEGFSGFKYWMAQTDHGGLARYSPGAPYTANKTEIFIAQWTPNTYTVVYDGNGATDGTTASSHHTYGEVKKLTANGFTRTGYTFAGWATSPTGAVVHADRAEVRNLTTVNGAAFTLYAVWQSLPE